MKRLNCFDITKESEELQKRWVRKTLVAHNHNTGDTLTFEEVWGVWDVRECGPTKWSFTIGKDMIRVFPEPRFPSDYSIHLSPPTVDEILGNTCIGSGLHEILVGNGDDIVRFNTETLRTILEKAYDVGNFYWFDDLFVPGWRSVTNSTFIPMFNNL